MTTPALPEELEQALEADPIARGLFESLRPADRVEYVEHVRAAKKAETRARRAAKTIELVHRRHARKTELKARGPAPITLATEKVLADVIGPSLSKLGFRASRRQWTSKGPASVRTVGVIGHWSNQTTSGRFGVMLGFTYPTLLTRDAQDPDHRFATALGGRGQTGLDFNFNDATDPADISRVRHDLATLWNSDHGLLLVEAAQDPKELCRYLLRETHARGGMVSALELAGRIGEPDFERFALDAYLTDLRDEHNVPWREGNPNAMGRLARSYSWAVPPSVRLGIDWDEGDRDRAHEAVTETMANVRAGGSQIAWYRHESERTAVVGLAQFVGLDIESELSAAVAQWTADQSQ